MRKAGLILLAVPALAALVWTGLWALAAREAGSRMDAWIAGEHARGRDWTCPGRETGGFPFALTLTCHDATYAGLAMGQRAQGKLGRLTAGLSLAAPRRIAVELSPPFDFRTSDGGTNVSGTWDALTAELSPTTGISEVSLHGRAVALDGVFAGAAGNGGRAAALDARFALAAAGAGPTLDFALAAAGVAVPAVDALLGGTAPADLSMDGQIDHADPGEAATPEALMERWRRAGGRVGIAHSLAKRAGASMAATGTLGLDEAHRLAGRLDAEFLGLGPVLARYGIGGDVAALGSLVGALFGSPRRAPAQPGALDLPINFRDGRLAIGPVGTPLRLAPLY